MTFGAAAAISKDGKMQKVRSCLGTVNRLL